MPRLIGYGTRIGGAWRITTPLVIRPLSTIFPAPSAEQRRPLSGGKE